MVGGNILNDGNIYGLDIQNDCDAYGLVLSAIALASLYFKDKPLYADIADSSYIKTACVFRNVVSNWTYSSPGRCTSIVLRGLVNSYWAFCGFNGSGYLKNLARGKVSEFVNMFLRYQKLDGMYDVQSAVPDHVQVQLKVDIGLLLAYEVLKDKQIIDSVKRNIDWIIKNRWDTSEKYMGGLIWGEDDSTSYFECHQAWFSIVTNYFNKYLMLSKHGEDS